jgi:hypothetical protein
MIIDAFASNPNPNPNPNLLPFPAMGAIFSLLWFHEVFEVETIITVGGLRTRASFAALVVALFALLDTVIRIVSVDLAILHAEHAVVQDTEVGAFLAVCVTRGGASQTLIVTSGLYSTYNGTRLVLNLSRHNSAHSIRNIHSKHMCTSLNSP